MMNLKKTLTGSVMLIALAASSVALAGKPVGITKTIMSVDTMHLVMKKLHVHVLLSVYSQSHWIQQ
jgi:hypothetical protein